MSESRRFDYEVQALRDDLDRTKAFGQTQICLAD